MIHTIASAPIAVGVVTIWISAAIAAALGLWYATHPPVPVLVEPSVDPAVPIGPAPIVPVSPANILDLALWKLTLPIGKPGKPTEVDTISLLHGFSQEPYFYVPVLEDVVVFTAPAGGVTTSGSSYPRSELREMADSLGKKASWSTTVGRHSMKWTAAVLALPPHKPHIVVGQIHDASNDVLVIRLEANHLFIDKNGKHLSDLDMDYKLGKEFTIEFVAEHGVISVYYESMMRVHTTVKVKRSGCYFKAGAYTQSNVKKGDKPDAIGQVAYRSLTITHSS